MAEMWPDWPLETNRLPIDLVRLAAPDAYDIRGAASVWVAIPE